ncbi:hypothetical protein ACGFRB_32275 [Streptomyces sp. NPDC048718]
MRARGDGLLVVIEALRRDEDFLFTFLRLLLALQKAFGIPWTAPNP